MMVLWRGSRCWTTTTGTGNPVGRPPSTCPRAMMPPAEAAMATMPYGSPGSALAPGSNVTAHYQVDTRTHSKRNGPRAAGRGAAFTPRRRTGFRALPSPVRPLAPHARVRSPAVLPRAGRAGQPRRDGQPRLDGQVPRAVRDPRQPAQPPRQVPVALAEQ